MNAFSDAGYVLVAAAVLAVAVAVIHRYRSYQAAKTAPPPIEVVEAVE